MAIPALIGIVALGVAKLGGSVWLASRATSPLSQKWREQFLEHAGMILQRLGEIGKPLPPPQLRSLNEDLALLRPHIAKGWVMTREFTALTRVANFVLWQHTKGAWSGIVELSDNAFRRSIDFFYEPVL